MNNTRDISDNNIPEENSLTFDNLVLDNDEIEMYNELLDNYDNNSLDFTKNKNDEWEYSSIDDIDNIDDIEIETLDNELDKLDDNDLELSDENKSKPIEKSDDFINSLLNNDKPTFKYNTYKISSYFNFTVETTSLI